MAVMDWLVGFELLSISISLSLFVLFKAKKLISFTQERMEEMALMELQVTIFAFQSNIG